MIALLWTVLSLFALQLTCAQQLDGQISDKLPLNSIDISLEANWKNTPSELSIIESFALVNDTFYDQLVLKLLGIEADYENGEFSLIEDEDYIPITPSELYDYAISLLSNDVDKYLVNLYLSNYIATPRIQAHYDYYRSYVNETNECERDVLLREPVGIEYYCDSEAAFMLKETDNAMLFDVIKLPFDRLIGISNTGKSYIIYGDFRDNYFRKMFFNMYQFAGVGKLNLVWRYVDSSPSNHYQKLSGYGAALNLKRTDYIAIDDRGFTKEQQERLIFNNTENEIKPEQLTRDNIFEINCKDIQKVDLSKLSQLGLKFTHFIINSLDKLSTLSSIISEFPKYAYHLSELEYPEDEIMQIYSDSVASLKSYIPTGIYINGAPIPSLKTDLFEIIKSIKRELNFLKIFETIGLKTQMAKDLTIDFATYMIKLFIHPTRRYDLSEFNKTIVYLNDIEKDKRYSHFKDSKDIYKNGILNGRLPEAKENIHQLIFNINILDPTQLEYVVQFTQQVHEQGIPIQIGIIPLLNTGGWNEKAVSKLFGTFHESGPQEAFNYLYMLNRFVSSNEPVTLLTFRALDFPYLDSALEDRYTKNLPNLFKTFALSKDTPAIFSNGILFDFNDIDAAIQNIFKDAKSLVEDLQNSQITSKTSLSKHLRKDSFKLRDEKLVPDEISIIKKQFLQPATFKAFKHWQALDSLRIVKNAKRNEALVTVNLIGCFLDSAYIKQVKEVLKYSINARGVKFVIVDSYATSDFKKLLAISDINEQIEFLEKLDYSSIQDDFEVKDTLRTIKEMYGLDYRDSNDISIIIAGRQIQIDGLFLTESKLESIVKYERFIRFNSLKKLYKQYKPEINFNDEFDKFEDFAWKTSYSFFFPVDDTYLSSELPRINLSPLPESNRIEKLVNEENELLSVIFIIDPVTEEGQELVSFIPLFENIPFISLTVHLRPTLEIEEMPINRFYKGNFNVNFTNMNNHIVFSYVPEKTLFNVGLNEPQRWLVDIKEASTDLDNIKLDLTNSHIVNGVFELKNILIEGYASYLDREENEFNPPGGLPIEIHNGEISSDTNVMANFGYFQLKANPGVWDFGIKSYTKGSLVFKSIEKDIKVTIIDLDGSIIEPKFEKSWGMESINLIEPIDNKPNESLISNFYINLMTKIYEFIYPSTNNADINIFTVASGHLYERFLGIMISSVMKNTKHSVKFWFIENFMSPELKGNLPILSKEYGFEYELIMYKWPIWLRSQRERQRTIWGYKILFLDVLFPQDLNKVIFVDSDQIVRTDLKELMDIDLEGAPYGYTPMGETRDEMEPFRFWKTGYWKELLNDKFKYHISALYVIDLIKFREIAAGDILRHHYQALSYDSNSLSNLDQDLPNNLQDLIKIHSLPNEWLWCETWCSDESLKDAKTIDLCNNPLTKEPKLDRARRQISEWVELDEEVSKLISNKGIKETVIDNDIEHDEL